MKTVACYIRISSGGKSQAAQKRGINQWLKSKRIDPKGVRWYIDKSSGDRGAFAKLQGDVSNREIGAVVLWHLDRLAPSIFEGLKILSDWSMKPLRIVSVT